MFLGATPRGIGAVFILEIFFEIGSGRSIGAASEVFGRSFGDDIAAVFTADGSHVDNPVGGFYHMEVMFDNNHGIPARDELVQDSEETFNVVSMETGRWLVEDVESASGRATGEFGCEFDPLSFAAGESCRGLTEADVAESDILQGFELVRDSGDIIEEGTGFVDGHL